MNEPNVKKKSIKQWKRDLIYGAVMILFAVGNMIYAGTLPPGSIRIKVAQAGTYLTIVMVLLGLLGIVLVVRSLVKKPDSDCELVFNRTTVITIASIALYILVLKKLGFLQSSFLLVFFLIAYYSWEEQTERVKGKALVKNLAKYAVCAILTTTVCWFLFGKVLTVVLPEFTLF